MKLQKKRKYGEDTWQVKVNAVNVRFEYWIIQIFEKLTTGLYKAYLYYNYWFIF